MSCLFDLSGTFPIKFSHALGFEYYVGPNKLSWSRPQLPNLKEREDSFWPTPPPPPTPDHRRKVRGSLPFKNY